MLVVVLGLLLLRPVAGMDPQRGREESARKAQAALEWLRANWVYDPDPGEARAQSDRVVQWLRFGEPVMTAQFLERLARNARPDPSVAREAVVNAMPHFLRELLVAGMGDSARVGSGVASGVAAVARTLHLVLEEVPSVAYEVVRSLVGEALQIGGWPPNVDLQRRFEEAVPLFVNALLDQAYAGSDGEVRDK